MIVGAYAMAVHGKPRATGDIDIWVEASQENAPRVYQALAAFGAPLDDLSIVDLEREGLIFQIGVAPLRIDILTSISGVTFSTAWPGRVQARFGDLSVPTIGIEDLVKNKRASGRPKDLIDVKTLERQLDSSG